MKEKLVLFVVSIIRCLTTLTVIDLPGVSPQGRLAVAGRPARCRSARPKGAIRRVRQIHSSDFVRWIQVMRMIKPIELLVPVSFMRCRTSTPGLSTWWSSTALIGNTRFQVGFPLRCLQRLSRPYIATLLCGWRHNRSTRDTSIPVLSY
jgi:hypothetical protein